MGTCPPPITAETRQPTDRPVGVQGTSAVFAFALFNPSTDRCSPQSRKRHHRCGRARGKQATLLSLQGYALCLLELPDITQQTPSYTGLQIEVAPTQHVASPLRESEKPIVTITICIRSRPRNHPTSKQTPLFPPKPVPSTVSTRRPVCVLALLDPRTFALPRELGRSKRAC
jgi:hypothetical protein